MRKRLNKIFGRCCSLYNIKMSHNNFTFYLIHLIGLRSKCESIKKYKKKDNDDDIDIKKRRKVGTCEEFHFMLLIYRVSKLYHYFKSHSIKCILNLTKLCISFSCSTKNPQKSNRKICVQHFSLSLNWNLLFAVGDIQIWSNELARQSKISFWKWKNFRFFGVFSHQCPHYKIDIGRLTLKIKEKFEYNSTKSEKRQ